STRGKCAVQEAQEAAAGAVADHGGPAGVVQAFEVETAPGGGEVGPVGVALPSAGVRGAGQGGELFAQEFLVVVTALVHRDQAVAAGGSGVVESAVELRVGDLGHVEIAELGEEPVVLLVAAGVDAGPAGEVEAVELLLGGVGVTGVESVDLVASTSQGERGGEGGPQLAQGAVGACGGVGEGAGVVQGVAPGGEGAGTAGLPVARVGHGLDHAPHDGAGAVRVSVDVAGVEVDDGDAVGFLSAREALAEDVGEERVVLLVPAQEVGQPSFVDGEQPGFMVGPAVGGLTTVGGEERLQDGVVVRPVLVLTAVVVGAEHASAVGEFVSVGAAGGEVRVLLGRGGGEVLEESGL